MHKWQEEFATAARLDHEEMMTALSEVKSTQVMSHDLLQNKVEENSAILRGMMGMMQDVCINHYDCAVLKSRKSAHGRKQKNR
jgi:hypothetical protein